MSVSDALALGALLVAMVTAIFGLYRPRGRGKLLGAAAIIALGAGALLFARLSPGEAGSPNATPKDSSQGSGSGAFFSFESHKNGQRVPHVIAVSGQFSLVPRNLHAWFFVQSDGLYYPRPLHLGERSAGQWVARDVIIGEPNEGPGSDFLLGVLLTRPEDAEGLRQASTSGMGMSSLPPGLRFNGPVVQRAP